MKKAPDDAAAQRVQARILLIQNRRSEAGAVIDALLAASVQDHEAWNLRGRLLADSGSGAEALEAWRRAIGLLSDPDHFDGIERRQIVRDVVKHLESEGNLEEAGRFHVRANVPDRDPVTDPALIDLGAYYNAALNDCWFLRSELRNPGPALATLARGASSFLGVRFDVRGVIQLNDRQRNFLRTYPNEVTGIPIGLRGDQIHFLHAVSMREPVGTVVARYRIHYANGETQEFPVTYGRDVRDFWDADIVDDAVTAWRGVGVTPDRADVALFLSSWDNPLPSETMTSIDFVSALSQSQPFLLGIFMDLTLNTTRN